MNVDIYVRNIHFMVSDRAAIDFCNLHYNQQQ